jgi:hypothetical protein
MSKNVITVKYKVNVVAYCNWENLHNLGLEEDEIETDILAIKDSSGVIEKIKGMTINGTMDYSASLKNHSFQISSDENEIHFITTFSFDEEEDAHNEEEIKSEVFNKPNEEYPDGIMELWKNENGDLVRPIEIIE